MTSTRALEWSDESNAYVTVGAEFQSPSVSDFRFRVTLENTEGAPLIRDRFVLSARNITRTMPGGRLITKSNWRFGRVASGVCKASIENCQISGIDLNIGGDRTIGGHRAFIHGNIYNMQNGVCPTTFRRARTIISTAVSSPPRRRGVRPRHPVSHVVPSFRNTGIMIGITP